MHNCGHCMYHYSKKCNVNSLGSQETNKMKYWYCGHPDRRKRDKAWYDGKDCEQFEDRYENQAKFNEWIGNVHKAMRGGKHGRRRNACGGGI